MPLTPRQTIALEAMHRYGYVRTAQVRDLIARAEGKPDWDKDASLTREVMRSLLAADLVRRHFPKLTEERGQAAPPVFVLSLEGGIALAEAKQDVRWLIQVERNFQDWMSINHWCGLTSLHMTTDAAFASQQHVRLHRLVMEHEVVDARAKRPSDRYALHTTVSDSPLVLCCPDSAMEISVATHHDYVRILYAEYETGADGNPTRVIAKKHKGYAGLAERQHYRRHSPHARDMRVIAYCPYDSFRDSLRKAMADKPGKELWLFVTRAAVTPETFLHGDIFYSTDRGPFPLVPPPAAPAPPPKAEDRAGDLPEEDR